MAILLLFYLFILFFLYKINTGKTIFNFLLYNNFFLNFLFFMSNFNSNITPDDVIEQLNNTAKPKNFVSFDPKNYLNTKLENGESSKTITIRLLPINKDGGFPFQKVHMHTIKVNKEVSPSGWKTLPCPIQNGFGDTCPFCEVSDQAYEMKKKATNDSEKKKYDEINMHNRARTMYVVRCIERDHENDGVKFWLMSGAKEGPYEKIMKLWSARYKQGLKMNRNLNIFDLNNGYDLEVTISKGADGKNVYSVVDSKFSSPLTNDFELGNKWINDEKKWSDVYKVKPYDYMSILLDGDVPYFNKEKNCYVGKLAESNGNQEEETQDDDPEPIYSAHSTEDTDLPY